MGELQLGHSVAWSSTFLFYLFLEIRNLGGGQQQLAVITPQVGDLIRIIVVHACRPGLAQQVAVAGACQLIGIGVEVMGQHTVPAGVKR